MGFGHSFDIVLAWWTLCYYDTPDESMSPDQKKNRQLAGIRKVLSAKGILILCEPVVKSNPEMSGRISGETMDQVEEELLCLFQRNFYETIYESPIFLSKLGSTLKVWILRASTI